MSRTTAWRVRPAPRASPTTGRGRNGGPGTRQARPALPRANEAALRRQVNAIKRAEFPWMLKLTKNAPQMAIMQLGRAVVMVLSMARQVGVK